MNIEEYIELISDKHQLNEKIPFLFDEGNLSIFTEVTISVHCERVGCADSYMFSSFPFWKNLNYSDWLSIFYKFIAIHKQGGSLFGLECFMSFFYFFLKVDLISIYAETEILDKQVKDWILGGYVRRPGTIFYYTASLNRFEDRLQKYDLSYNNLLEIGQNLISQGAYKAEKIPHIKEYIDGLPVYNVEVGIPKSWKSWAKEYKMDK
jgi:hypothetical protein